MKKQKGKNIEFASTMGDSGVQLGIVEVEDRELGRKGKLIREASYQRKWRLVSFQLPFYNKYNVLKYVKLDNRSSTQNIKGVKDVRRIIKPLREVWIQVEVEKIDTYEGIFVKALLDSRATELFANKRFVKKWGFKKKKLARLIQIRNVDRTNNSEGMVMYKIEYNLYYKRYIE